MWTSFQEALDLLDGSLMDTGSDNRKEIAVSMLDALTVSRPTVQAAAEHFPAQTAAAR